MDASHNFQVLDWAADFDKELAARQVTPAQVEASSLPIAARAELPAMTNSLPSSILSNWGQIASAGISKRMYNDFVRLSLRPDGWRGPGSKALQASSLNSFLRFWSQIRNDASEPELALAPEGEIHAEWFKSTQKHLDIRFSNERLIFGLINGGSIIEGADRSEIVTNVLRSHYANPLSWSAK